MNEKVWAAHLATQAASRAFWSSDVPRFCHESGGEGGIRTHGTREGSTVFETAPFDHSGTSPRFGWCGAFIGAGVEAQGLSRKNRTVADEPTPEDPSR